MAGGAGSAIGRGGMLTKVLAAKRAARSGASTVIASGREPDVLLRLAAGEAIGTALVARMPKMAARKQWMANHLQLHGSVVVDDGAAAKVRSGGKSLLPIGIVEVQGDFARGDVIAVRNAAGIEIARGLANYSSAEARLIARRPRPISSGCSAIPARPRWSTATTSCWPDRPTGGERAARAGAAAQPQSAPENAARRQRGRSAARRAPRAGTARARRAPAPAQVAVVVAAAGR